MLGQLRHEGLRDFGEALGVGAGTALHVDFEATGLADAANGRRIERERNAVAQRPAFAVDLREDLLRRDRAIFPAFQRNEHGRGVGFVAAADQIEAVDDQHVFNGRMIGQHGLHLAGRLRGALQRGAIGQLHGPIQESLILGGHETAGNAQEHRQAQDNDPQEGQQRTHAPP